MRGPRLVQDYHAGAPELAPFFSGWPWDPEAYRHKAREVAGRFDSAARRRAAAVMRPTSGGAAAKLEAVVREGGYFVTTGQQAGLLTGPLYTIYKALSAVRLARALEPVLEKPVAPVFWVASSDHDWNEVNHIRVLDVENRLHRLELVEAPDAVPVSMARHPVGPGIADVLRRLTELLPPSEFVEPLLARIREAYRPERTMAEAYADLLGELLGPFDVLLVDPSHAEVAALAAPLLRAEIQNAAEHERRLERQTARLVAAGYHGQVGVGDGAVNVAYEDKEGRQRLVRDGDSFVLRRTKRRLTEDELLARLETTPERFSATVLLRPVVESALFPTVAYVAGPSELCYFAQMGCLFKAHAIEMPLVFPRFSVTLVERKVRKVMDKFGLSVEDFRQPARELAARIVRDELPAEVDATVSALRRQLDEGYAALVAATKSIDPTLKGPLTAAKNTSHVALREAEKKILARLKDQRATTVEQLEKAAANLAPEGAPQERVLNPVQYLARYGPELLSAVAEALRVELGAAAPAWRGVECGV